MTGEVIYYTYRVIDYDNSAYAIEHVEGRGLLKVQEVVPEGYDGGVMTIVCDLYEFGFYVQPGTTLRIPKVWASKSKIEMVNGRTGGGEGGDNGTYIEEMP
jgi:hypothetical protein